MTRPPRMRYYPRHARPARRPQSRRARPQGRDRHRPDRRPRPLRAADGQANGGPLLRRPRPRRRRARLHLPAHGGHGDGAAHGLHPAFLEQFERARARRYDNLTPVSDHLEDYHVLQTTKEEPLVRANRNGMEAADVPVETSKGEWGRGQEEINLVYAEALEMADRATLYKHGAKEIAHLQSCSLTFMAKYDMGAAGSSFHLHSSLWDRAGKKALFAPTGRARGANGRTSWTPLF